jgi:DNA repair exonuclease SbcCD ATPase subunit
MDDLQMTSVREYRLKLERKKGERTAIAQSIKKLEEDIKDTRKDIARTEEALAISQSVASRTQDMLVYHISDVVSLALNSVLDDPCEFVLEFTTKANRTQCEMGLKVGDEVLKPYFAKGGGVVDLAAFALRVALLNLYEGRVENILVLDEPLKFLSRKLLPKAAEMLKMISKELNIQILMITHLEELEACADRIFDVRIRGGVSEVREREDVK